MHRFYVGISEDPQSRLQQHNSGILHGWTARHRPWRLVWTEKHVDYTSAKKRENSLKAQKGGKGVLQKRQAYIRLSSVEAHSPAKRDPPPQPTFSISYGLQAEESGTQSVHHLSECGLLPAKRREPCSLFFLPDPIAFASVRETRSKRRGQRN